MSYAFNSGQFYLSRGEEKLPEMTGGRNFENNQTLLRELLHDPR